MPERLGAAPRMGYNTSGSTAIFTSRRGVHRPVQLRRGPKRKQHGLDRSLHIPNNFRRIPADPDQPDPGDLDHPDSAPGRPHHQSGSDHPGVPSHHRSPGAHPDDGDRPDRHCDRGLLCAAQAQRRFRAGGDERGGHFTAPGVSPGTYVMHHGCGHRCLYFGLSGPLAATQDGHGNRQGKDGRRFQYRPSGGLHLGRSRADISYSRAARREPVPGRFHRRYARSRGARHHRG